MVRHGTFTTEGGKRLDKSLIQQNLGSAFNERLIIDVLEEADSTNDVILRLPSAQRHGRVVLAERQTAGKGCRARAWQSPEGNLFLSLGWRFDSNAGDLQALALVTAICVCQALDRMGLLGHCIKWPNDIVIDGAKLGGILVETSGNGQGVDAVIGIGINIFVGDEAAASIDQPWTDLVRQPAIETLDRSAIAAELLWELLVVLDDGPEAFSEFVERRWAHWDGLTGCDVSVSVGDDHYVGRACGVTADGALRVVVFDQGPFEGGRRLMEFRSGEVSVRRA